MTRTVLLLLSSTFILTAAGYPTGSRAGGQQSATWDDVNLVAHGLLQLGQALKEHVEKSKGQMREMNARVKSINASLERTAQEQRGEIDELRQRVDRLEETGQDRRGGRDELVQRVERLERRVEELVKRTEMEGNFSEDTSGTFVQKMLGAQNRRLEQLLEKIRQQQDKLDKQSVHLQSLHNKIGHKRLKSLRQRSEDREQKALARDCHHLFVSGQRESGVYTVQPGHSKPFQVLCEMTPEGGWTVFQKRFDGSQSFDQSWDSYRRGFGQLTGEFWLGLDHIHALSSSGRHLLHTELSDWSGQSHVIASEFRLDGEERKFSLHLTPLSAGDVKGVFSSSGSSGLPFSTADQDNDLSTDSNCAQIHSGGWWFSSCGDANLNGHFSSSTGSRDMFWTTSGGQRSMLRSTVMKMAPLSTRH